MDDLVGTITKVLTEGGPQAIMTLGWLLYLLERYILAGRREKEFREDLESFRKDYQLLADRLSATLGNFSTVLEVIKDRIGRSGQ